MTSVWWLTKHGGYMGTACAGDAAALAGEDTVVNCLAVNPGTIITATKALCDAARRNTTSPENISLSPPANIHGRSVLHSLVRVPFTAALLHTEIRAGGRHDFPFWGAELVTTFILSVKAVESFWETRTNQIEAAL